MITPPDTQYAYSGDFAIAYQVLGAGTSDLIYLPGWVGSVEANWLAPDQARFLGRLSSFCRLIVMDRRGTGCSDRLPPGETPSLEDGVADIRVVQRAAHSTSSILFGVEEAGFFAMFAAATHPERFDRLILFGAAHTYRRTEDAPWAWDDDRWEDTLVVFGGTRPTEVAEGYIRQCLPSYARDPAEVRRMAMLLALTQSPGAAVTEGRWLLELNLKDLLPTIRVPTLVLHRTDDPVEPVESGRYLAEHIPDATLVELPGRDALPWLGEVDRVLEEIERFVTGSTSGAPLPSSRVLATVLFTDVVDSTRRAGELGDGAFRELLERHNRAIRAELARHQGLEIDTAGDGFLMTFEGPALAVECGLAISRAIRELGLEVRAGVHTGEMESIDGKVRGIAVHVGARVAAAAGPSEVLVSSTVRDLVAGSGLRFDEVGEYELKGVAEPMRLYRAREPEE